MRLLPFELLFAGALAAGAVVGPEAFVPLRKFDFSIIDGTPRCLVRKELAAALARAQASLKLSGRRLKALACYRPAGEDRAFAKGNAIDVTLVAANGADLSMPTPYRSDKPLTGAFAKKAKLNAAQLTRVLTAEGLTGSDRWYHFELKVPDARVEDFPISEVK